MAITDQQVERYARHILLPEIGGTGQAKLLKSSVLVVGGGGLGAPVIQYLAAAGVGTIGIIDDDEVDLSNLQRQVIHTTDRVGMKKVESARQSVAALNPDVTVNALDCRLTADNAQKIITQYDIVADGCDNFATRFLINDTCHLIGKTLVSGAILRFDGQLITFKTHARKSQSKDEETGYPCYRCLYPAPPPLDMVPTCAEAGVLGALCGIIGSLQAAEVVKELIGAGDSLAGSLLIFDGLRSDFRKVRIKPDPACRLCGEEATINDLSGIY